MAEEADAINTELAIPSGDAQLLLETLSGWGTLTTIILHAGSVFEFKGEFPKGDIAQGYYNLNSEGKGFEGHIKLDSIDNIQLQKKQHRGRDSYVIVFNNDKETIFKVFLGRDQDGNIYPQQLERFQSLQAQYR